MGDTFKAARISENVWWVGAIDWHVRNFHGYSTDKGTTYNAYLVTGKENILVDTVKAPFVEEMFARIADVIDPRKIDVILSNHSEMDHSGGLPEAARRIDPETILASARGAEALDRHFGMGSRITAVADGETRRIGDHTLRFLETRMVHWPDSMFSFLVEDALLFSQDGFGMHYASEERFVDQVPRGVMEREQAKYFYNILLPYAKKVEQTIDAVKQAGLLPRIVAPDHGPVFRRSEDFAWVLDRYAAWCEQKPTDRAIIVYDTMWQSTDRMARVIAEGIVAGGARVKLCPLGEAHRSDAISELADAGALLVGSPTLNSNIFPTVADFLTYAKGLRPRNLVGAAFGSYGWANLVVKQLGEALKEMDVELIHEGLGSQYVPDAKSLDACFALGRAVAQRITRSG